MSIVAVQVPMGIPPGGQFLAIAPNGAQMMVVNPGVPPGSVIHVRCPPPPMPVYGGPQPSSMERVAPAPPPPTEALKPDDIPADAEIASATVPGFTKTTLAEAPKQEELCPCAACCCVTYSIYPVFPDCMGAYCKGVACMCIEVEQLLCKVSKTEGVFCKLCNGELEIVKPVGCCKLAATVCCVDARIAFPTDAEVPCQVALAGFICCKSMECVCKLYDSKDATETPKKAAV